MSTMWICKWCGNLVEELGLSFDHVPLGGRTFPVKVYRTDCRCGGEYVHASRCGECGEYYADDDLTDDLCAACFDKTYNADYALAHDARAFLYYVFGDEADKILACELKKRKRDEIEQAARAFYREVL